MSDPHEQATNDEEALSELRMQWEAERHRLWIESLSDEDRESYEGYLESWNDEP